MICVECCIDFEYPGKQLRKYCGRRCKSVAGTRKRHLKHLGREDDPLSGLNTATRGALSELYVTIDLLAMGYMVFRNTTPSGSVDVVALKHGDRDSTLRVEVKSSLDPNKVPSCRYERGVDFDTLAVVARDGGIQYYGEVPNAKL